MRSSAGDSSGQLALVDAILFMTVMLVASAVVIGSVSHSSQGISEMQRYTEGFSRTLLSVELDEIEYVGVEGSAINLGQSGRSIARLLCDESMILKDGAGQSDFSATEARILSAGKFILRPDMDFAISCNGGAVFISENAAGLSGLPGTRSASQITILTGDNDSDAVTITVYVWVV